MGGGSSVQSHVTINYNNMPGAPGQPRMFKDDLAAARNVWYRCIAKRPNFFNRIFQIAMARHEPIAGTLGISAEKMAAKHGASEMNERFHAFTEKVRKFVELMLATDDEGEFIDACVMCGVRHVGYVDRRFKTVYWDVFIVALIEALDDTGVLSGEEQFGFVRYMRAIIGYLRDGFDEGLRVRGRLELGQGHHANDYQAHINATLPSKRPSLSADEKAKK